MTTSRQGSKHHTKIGLSPVLPVCVALLFEEWEGSMCCILAHIAVVWTPVSPFLILACAIPRCAFTFTHPVELCEPTTVKGQCWLLRHSPMLEDKGIWGKQGSVWQTLGSCPGHWWEDNSQCYFLPFSIFCCNLGLSSSLYLDIYSIRI